MDFLLALETKNRLNSFRTPRQSRSRRDELGTSSLYTRFSRIPVGGFPSAQLKKSSHHFKLIKGESEKRLSWWRIIASPQKARWYPCPRSGRVSLQNHLVPSVGVNETFWNVCFDKGRLKNFVSWFYKTYGNYKTVQLVEQLKDVGFQYATKSGLSLGIDDLKIPPQKGLLMLETEQQTKKTVNQYNRGEITGVERFQRLIDAWHRTSELLKQEVINNFEKTDILNPVYMMAFSGARGNISQVRQLVGMRGLMADPQGQILDFPIRSNFREGLTLTEYIISCYGARKGIVDTALRTANAGYLTRRLVDVAQHVIVSHYDCGTKKGIFLKDMKEGNKTIYSLQNRLIGRVLAQDLNIFKSDKSNTLPGENHTHPHSTHSLARRDMDSKGNRDNEASGWRELNNVSHPYVLKKTIAFRNQEISTDLAFQISQVYKKVFVRSPLTCSTKKLVCQLCYGWSLAQGNLVSIGEAVGVIAAQSIGEPGTQLTMRTFHTGGVFSGDLTELIQAPYSGFVRYAGLIPGTLIRTPQGQIAFLTKDEGVIFLLKNNKITNREPSHRLASVSNQQVSVSSHSEISSGHKGIGASSFAKSENQKDLMNSFFASMTDFKYAPNELEQAKKYKIPAYTILFVRNGENVIEKQILAQISSFSRQKNMRDTAELTIKSELEGQFYAESLETVEKLIGPKLKDEELRSNYDYMHFLPVRSQYARNRNVGHPHYPAIEKIKEAWDWSSAWILSGKIYQFPIPSSFFPKTGDLITQHSPLTQIQWMLPESPGQYYSLNLSSNYSSSDVRSAPSLIPFWRAASNSYAGNQMIPQRWNGKGSATLNRSVLSLSTLNVEKSILSLKAKSLKYSKIGYFLKTVPNSYSSFPPGRTLTLNSMAKLIAEDSIFAPFSSSGPRITKSFDFSPSNVESIPNLGINKEATAVNTRHWNPLLNNFVEWFPKRTKMSTGGLLAVESCLFKPRLFVCQSRTAVQGGKKNHPTLSNSLGNWKKGNGNNGIAGGPVPFQFNKVELDGVGNVRKRYKNQEILRGRFLTPSVIDSFRHDLTKKRKTKSFFFTSVSKQTVELKSHYMYLIQLQRSLFGLTNDSSLSQTEFKNLVFWPAGKQEKMPKFKKQGNRPIWSNKVPFETRSVITLLNNFSAFSKIANFEYQFKLDPKHRLYEQFRYKKETGYQHLQSLQIPAPYVAHRNRKIFSTGTFTIPKGMARSAGNQTKSGSGVANKKHKTDIKSLRFLCMQWKNPLISTLNPNTTAFTVPKTTIGFFNLSKTRLFWMPQHIYKLNFAKFNFARSLFTLQTQAQWRNTAILCVNRQQKTTRLIGNWPYCPQEEFPFLNSLFKNHGLMRCFVRSIKKKQNVLSVHGVDRNSAEGTEKSKKKGEVSIKRFNQADFSGIKEKGMFILLNKKHVNSMHLFVKLKAVDFIPGQNKLPQIGCENLYQYLALNQQSPFKFSKHLKKCNTKILFYRNSKVQPVKLPSHPLGHKPRRLSYLSCLESLKKHQKFIKLHNLKDKMQTVLDPKLVKSWHRGSLLRSFCHFEALEQSRKRIMPSTPFRWRFDSDPKGTKSKTSLNLGLNGTLNQEYSIGSSPTSGNRLDSLQILTKANATPLGTEKKSGLKNRSLPTQIFKVNNALTVPSNSTSLNRKRTVPSYTKKLANFLYRRLENFQRKFRYITQVSGPGPDKQSKKHDVKSIMAPSNKLMQTHNPYNESVFLGTKKVSAPPTGTENAGCWAQVIHGWVFKMKPSAKEFTAAKRFKKQGLRAPEGLASLFKEACHPGSNKKIGHETYLISKGERYGALKRSKRFYFPGQVIFDTFIFDRDLVCVEPLKAIGPLDSLQITITPFNEVTLNQVTIHSFIGLKEFLELLANPVRHSPSHLVCEANSVGINSPVGKIGSFNVVRSKQSTVTKSLSDNQFLWVKNEKSRFNVRISDYGPPYGPSKKGPNSSNSYLIRKVLESKLPESFEYKKRISTVKCEHSQENLNGKLAVPVGVAKACERSESYNCSKFTNLLINKAWNSTFIYQQFKSDSVNKQNRTSNTIIKFPKTDFSLQAKTSYASLLIKLKNQFVAGWLQNEAVSARRIGGAKKGLLKDKQSKKTKKSSKASLTGAPLKELNAIFNRRFKNLLDKSVFHSSHVPKGDRDESAAKPKKTYMGSMSKSSHSSKNLRGIQLDVLYCQKPVNLNSFLIDLKTPYGLNSIFKKPTVYFNCNNHSSVIPQYLQACNESLQCYESLLKTVLESKIPVPQRGLGMTEQAVKILYNAKKTKALPSLYHQLSITFQQPCFNFCLATSLNMLKQNKVNSPKKTIRAPKVKARPGLSPHKTKFHVNLNNKFSSYSAFAKTSFFSSFEGEILKPSYLPLQSPDKANKKLPSWFLREIQFKLKQNKHSCLMLTKKDLRSFTTGLSVSKTTVLRQLFFPNPTRSIHSQGPQKNSVLRQILKLGQFMSKGDLIKTKQLALTLEHSQQSELHKIIKGVKTSGQIVHIGIHHITLRAGQSIFISPQSIFHVSEGSYVNAKSPVITLAYQRLKTGDIVQGIPKVEQFFEARSTKGSRLFNDSLPNLLVALYKRYSQTKTGTGSKKRILTNQEAVRQSFYKIQQIVVDGVQRVYLSQGVAISDKHLEIIVKQMTSKVIIVAGGPDGFFPGEMIDIDFVEKINKLLINKKIRYEPVLLGITRASLEVPSFLSAASFQQSTRILTRAALFTKKDYLRGLKENIMLGNLIPAGTGYLISDLFR